MALIAPRPKRITVVRRGEILRGPVVSTDSIYAGSHRDVTVRLDRETLKPVWTIESDGALVGRLVGDELLTVGGPSGAGVRRTSDGHLVWRQEARFQGALVWRGHMVIRNRDIELRDPETGGIQRAIEVPAHFEDPGVLSDDSVLLRDREARTIAIGLESGRLEWDRDLGREMAGYLHQPSHDRFLRVLPGSQAGLFVAMHGGATFGCSLTDGSILWHVPTWSPPDSWPTIDGGRLFILLRDRLTAVDEATGQILFDRWHPELGSSYREKAGTVYKDRLAIATESGHLAIFCSSDGSLLSLYESRAPLWRTAEADGRLLGATGDGTLLVFGESIWGL